MARVSRKVGAITESATLAVDAKAKALRAAGEPVIGFGAGEPDFPTPRHIVDAAVAACHDPRNHHYTPTAGLPELRAAIAAKTTRDSGLACEAGQVVVTNGAKQAVAETCQVLLDPGDEVLLAAPYWTTYPEAIALADGTPVVLPTTEASGFRVSVDALEAARTPRTKALLFVSPSNPTGVVYPPAEVEAIGRWALEHGIWVVTDEIYEHLTFGEHRFSSMPALVPELADRSVVVNGVAKTYAMTGWRVGWIIAPPDVAAAATNLQSHVSSNVANVSQRAALAAVSGDLDAVATMRQAFARVAAASCTSCCRRSRGCAASHPKGPSTASRPSSTCSATSSRGPRRPRASSCAGWPSTRLGWRSCPARRSVPRDTRGCRSRSPTRNWSRVWNASPSCCADPATGATGNGPAAVGELPAAAHEHGRPGRVEPVARGGGTTIGFPAVAATLACRGPRARDRGARARGIDAMRAAGLEVEERLGLTPDGLLDAMPGVAALVIRSATQVDEQVLEAGRDLVVVGRAGIGLDNVDVDAATRRGVMVVNAPQSNVLSAAEHTIALLLAQARNIPQADADLKSGAWDRSRWEGVELHNKTLGIVGLGRVGVLVAQRASAFGMRLLAYDPYVSVDRARQLGVGLVPALDELVRQADFLTIHLPKTPETIGLVDAELLSHAKPTLRLVNAARGGIVDEAALADALRGGRIAGAALDVFAAEPTVESPLFELPNVVVTPHLGASTVEAQDKAGQTIAEQVVLALRGEFVPYAVNLAATEANATVQPFLPLAERLGRLFTALSGGVVETLEVSYEGEIADYDCRVLTLAVLKGVLQRVVDEPVSFVNAPQLAASRGLVVRETTSSSALDYVNLITLRGTRADQLVHVAGTLFGKRAAPRIVAIDEHSVDVPPTRHMLVVHNADEPGMIGTVGTILGGAWVNIADMDVGTNAEGAPALMVIATDTPVPGPVIERLRAEPGILDARALELD